MLIRIMDGLLGVGLASVIATRLRFPLIGVGIGEVLLLCWLILQFSSVCIKPEVTVNRGFVRLSLFWLVSLFLLVLGWMNALGKGVVSDGAMHDTMALAFCAAISILAVGQKDSEYHLRRVAAWFYWVTGLGCLSLYFYGILHNEISGISLWFGNRFTALTTNPNQLSLVLSVLPFIGIYLARNESSRWGFLKYMLLIPLFGFPAFATQSEAVLMGWVAGGGVLVTLYAGAKINISRITLVSILSLLVLFVLIVTFFFSPELIGKLTEYFETRQKNQADIRFALWQSGLHAIFLLPPIGWGGGALSGPEAPFMGWEAHNSFIDWTTATGLLGLGAYLYLVVPAVFVGLKNRLTWPLVAGFASLTIFSLFHYTFRQPVWWFFIGLLVVSVGRMPLKCSNSHISVPACNY